jgi:hypothetical protein
MKVGSIIDDTFLCDTKVDNLAWGELLDSTSSFDISELLQVSILFYRCERTIGNIRMWKLAEMLLQLLHGGFWLTRTPSKFWARDLGASSGTVDIKAIGILEQLLHGLKHDITGTILDSLLPLDLGTAAE